MNVKLLLLPLSAALFLGCASNKLNNTVWYNITMMEENGVVCNVGTSLFFDTDSTVAVYKGVAIDTTTVIPPFVFAHGKYWVGKKAGRDMNVTLTATKRDGMPLTYHGVYNKKNKMMLMSVPDSRLKETYFWNPKAKTK